MAVGFVVSCRDSVLLVETFVPRPQAAPALVSTWGTATHRVVCLGRLHYVEELLRAVGEHIGIDEAGNHAQVTHAVFRRLGADGLRRLEGNFAIAVWDRTRGQLFALRDPMGSYPLYWATKGTTFALATSLPLLHRVVPHGSVNRGYLADVLGAPGPANERASEDCVFEGVHRVVAGTRLRVALPELSIDRERHWDWRQVLVEADARTWPEAAEEYRHVLRSAVGQRLSATTLVHLSGGLDSTTVAVLAKDVIDRGEGTASSASTASTLHTVSLVYERLRDLARETPYVEAAMAFLGGHSAQRIVGDGILDFDAFSRAPRHDEPYVGLYRLGMDQALTQAAEAVGATTVLTGLGGDEVLDVQPLHIADELRRCRVRTAWREACRWAEFDNANPWRLLTMFGLTPLLSSPELVGVLSRLARSDGSRLLRERQDSVPEWIVPGFAREYELRERAVADLRERHRSYPSTAASFIVSALRSRVGDPVAWMQATPKGIAVSHPFLDLRVVRLGLGVLLAFGCAAGPSKPLLREAMRDRLPTPLLQRRRKGHFNEIYYLGLSKNRRWLEDLVRRAPVDDLEILDKEALIACLGRGAVGGVSMPMMQRVNLALAFLRWIELSAQPAAIEFPTAVFREPVGEVRC